MRLTGSCVLVALTLGFVATGGTQPARPRVPEELRVAETGLDQFLLSFRGRTRAQVEERLGPPTEVTTWESKVGPEPLLRYSTPSGGDLSIYLHREDDHVLIAQYCLRR